MEHQYYVAASAGALSTRTRHAPRASSGSSLQKKHKGPMLTFSDAYTSAQPSQNRPGHKFQQVSSKSSLLLTRHSSQQRSEFRKKLAEMFTDGPSTPAVENVNDNIFGVGPRTVQPKKDQKASDLNEERSKGHIPSESGQAFDLIKDDQTSRLPRANLKPSEGNVSDRGQVDEIEWPNNLKHSIRKEDLQSGSPEEHDFEKIALKNIADKDPAADLEIETGQAARSAEREQPDGRLVQELEWHM